MSTAALSLDAEGAGLIQLAQAEQATPPAEVKPEEMEPGWTEEEEPPPAEVKPAAPEVKPAVPEVKPAAPEVKPAVPEVKPAEVKPPEPRKAPAVRAPQPAPPAAGPVSFFFDDADIFEVVQTVFGEILKVNYLIDSKVSGRVNFRTVTPVPREEVLPIMEIILRLNGIGFVEEKGLYRIIPLTEVPSELIYAQAGKEPEKVAVELFSFKNLNIKDAMTDIESAIGLSLQTGKTRIIPIYRLNAIMVVANSKEQMDYVRKWLEIMDGMFGIARPKIYVYPLQNSKASHVASMLQSILGGGGGGAPSPSPAAAPKPAAAGAAAPTPAAPKAGPSATVTGGGGFLVSPETKIFADEITNSLVILATPGDYAFIEETIKKIDVLPRQVVIEGLLVRVDLIDNLSFGFSWAFKTDLQLSNLKPFSKYGIDLSGEVNINNPANAAQNLSTQGFTFAGTDPNGNVRAVLTALAQESKAKILAAPHILVSDNREARIQVGQQIPLATSTTTQPLSTTTTTTTTVASTSTIQYKDIGIILKVKPQINDSGLVSLEVTQEVSSQGADVNIAGQAFSSINKTEATTNLVAQDGETIIIGGLIREDVTKAKDGIPFLSKIPLIGNLFGTTTDNTTRAELIILLTPRVVRTMEEAGGVTSDYVEKYKGVAKDKEVNKFIEERGKKEKGDEGPSK